jgi:DNA-binding beta-propeller fold protein YncE
MVAIGRGRFPWTACALALVAATLLLVGGSASAAAATKTYASAGFFGAAGTGDGEFTAPRRVAVQNATGDVYVVDSADNRVEVFQPSGSSAVYLTQFGSSTLNQPFGIAIDQSTGAVYVSDAGNNRIVKFDSDGAPTPSFTVDGTFTSPAQGSSAGQIGSFAAAVAVDPTNGDLLVADPGNNLVDRYDSTGAFKSSFDGSTSPEGAFTGLLDVNADPSGNVLVVDQNGDVVLGGGSSRVERFDASGNYLASFPVPAPGLVAADPADGAVRVLGNVDYGDTPQIYVFDTSDQQVGSPIYATPNAGSSSSLRGMAVDGGSLGRLYVVTDLDPQSGLLGSVGVEAFDPVFTPDASVDPATNVTTSGADVSGTVNPNGSDTTWHFEYSTDESTWTPTPVPDSDAGAGTSGVPVSASLSGLEPSTQYFVRLVATNIAGTTISSETSFTTGAIPPDVKTTATGERTATTARLTGRVDPHHAPTIYWFEYGTTTAYGTSVPLTQDADAGSGGSFTAVAQTATGLQPGTTYHYRIVARNSAGTATGADETVTTLTTDQTAGTGVGADRNRGLELVSTADDNGDPLRAAQVAISGDRTFYALFGGTPASSSGVFSWYLADRSASGWKARAALPPVDQQVDAAYVQSLSAPDLSAFTMVAMANVFGRPSPVTLVKLDDQNHQTVLHRFPSATSFSEVPTGAVSDTLDHIFKNSPEAIDPAQAPGTSDVYDFASGTPVLVSLMPDGSVPSCGVPIDGFASAAAESHTGQHWTSRDGTKLFFETQGNDCGGPRELYERDLTAGTTTLVSGPVVSGSDAGVDDPGLIQAAPDGSWVIYRTASALDPADTNTDPDIYRYVAGQGNTCLTCAVPDANVTTGTGTAIASQDGSHVYFLSGARLVPGEGATGAANLYVWSASGIRYVGQMTIGLASLAASPDYGVDLSQDGNVLVFTSAEAGMTADDNGGLPQYYRYDDGDGTLVCASCPRGRTAAQGVLPDMTGLSATSVASGHALSADGSTFAFRTPEALVPGDVNNAADLYEWRDGKVGLITDGTTAAQNVVVADVTADGRDVFFAASGPVVPGLPSDLLRLFDARIGGGFPPSPATPPACEGDTCQGSPPQSPGLSRSGSATLTVPPVSSASGSRNGFSVAKVTARQRAALARTGRLTLVVHVQGVARFSAIATARLGRHVHTVARASKVAHRAGTVRLVLRLSRAARAQLVRAGTLRVSIVVGSSRSRVKKRLALVLRAPRARGALAGAARLAHVAATAEGR